MRLTGTLGISPRAHGFEDRFRIRAVGLVASDIRAHVRRWHQCHPMPPLLGEAPPVVRHAAGFHDHMRGPLERQEPSTLAPIQALTRDDAPLSIRDATSSTCFARSTATVVPCISVSSLVALMGIS
jgi:hypothetical protein